MNRLKLILILVLAIPYASMHASDNDSDSSDSVIKGAIIKANDNRHEDFLHAHNITFYNKSHEAIETQCLHDVFSRGKTSAMNQACMALKTPDSMEYALQYLNIITAIQRIEINEKTLHTLNSTKKD